MYMYINFALPLNTTTTPKREKTTAKHHNKRNTVTLFGALRMCVIATARRNENAWQHTLRAIPTQQAAS